MTEGGTDAEMALCVLEFNVAEDETSTGSVGFLAWARNCPHVCTTCKSEYRLGDKIVKPFEETLCATHAPA